MTLIIILWISLLNASPVQLQTVKPATFSVGKSWVWKYSEINPTTGDTQPYYYEQYTVTAINAEQITIEMASSAQYPVTTPPHHRLIANISDCLSTKDLKSWTIEFYTKSFGPDWEIVSKQHKNLAFTEKFNCVSEWHSPLNVETVDIQGQPGSIAFLQIDINEPGSWFIQNPTDLNGVAYKKYFDSKYLFELIKF